MDANLFILALVAFGGGVVSALMGWADSQEPFNARKFIRSVGASILGGIAAVLTIDLSGGLTAQLILLAFLIGAGADVLTNRALGAMRG